MDTTPKSETDTTTDTTGSGWLEEGGWSAADEAAYEAAGGYDPFED
jgi:hypothetical protein